MMYKVCALVFSITCSSSTDFSDAIPSSIVRYPKREEGSDCGTHTHKKKGVVQPDDAAVAYILRLAVHFAYT